LEQIFQSDLSQKKTSLTIGNSDLDSFRDALSFARARRQKRPALSVFLSRLLFFAASVQSARAMMCVFRNETNYSFIPFFTFFIFGG